MLPHNRYIFKVTGVLFTFAERLLICAALWYAAAKLNDEFIYAASMVLYALAVYQIGMEVFFGIKHFGVKLPKPASESLAFFTVFALSILSFKFQKLLYAKFLLLAGMPH